MHRLLSAKEDIDVTTIKMHSCNLNKQMYPFMARDLVAFADIVANVSYSEEGILIRNGNSNSIQNSLSLSHGFYSLGCTGKGTD
jgi:hypothetical protein